MTTQSLSGTIHVLRDDVIYSACIGEKTHVGHYWFIGSCLVGADDDVYLEIRNDELNGYYNGINTHIGWQDANQLSFTVAYSPTEPEPTGYENNVMLFSNVYCSTSCYISYAADSWYSYENPTLINIVPNISMSQFKVQPKQSFNIEYTTNRSELITFGSWDDQYWSRTMRWYNVQIYNNSVLLRHFIPVPAGMVIGNYTVPSNGMWDIVEQRFYRNYGTGDFIYGVDE